MTDEAASADPAAVPVAVAAETVPWSRRPHWWPMVAWGPLSLIGLTALLAASQPGGGGSRAGMIFMGLVLLPLGTLLCVGLLVSVREDRHARAKRLLAGITTAVISVGALLWFNGAFQPPYRRAAITLFDMDPAAVWPLWSMMLCFAWGAILLVLALGFRIAANRADHLARRAGRGEV